MNTTSMVVATGTLVVIGRWSEDRGMDVKIVVGVVVLAVMLSLIPDEVSGPLGALVLTVALFRYVPSIVKQSKIAK